MHIFMFVDSRAIDDLERQYLSVHEGKTPTTSWLLVFPTIEPWATNPQKCNTTEVFVSFPNSQLLKDVIFIAIETNKLTPSWLL